MCVCVHVETVDYLFNQVSGERLIELTCSEVVAAVNIHSCHRKKTVVIARLVKIYHTHFSG